jgi:hypothetical protein
MNSSPEDFDGLRKLLLLKRFEQPPPGFFKHFSDKVIARIEADGLAVPAPWWQRWFRELDAKPLLACAYGLVITGLLVVGLGVSQSMEPDGIASPKLGSPWFAQAPASTLPVNAAPTRQLTDKTGSASSVNPVFAGSAPSFLFDVNQLRVERASYNLP